MALDFIKILYKLRKETWIFHFLEKKKHIIQRLKKKVTGQFSHGYLEKPS